MENFFFPKQNPKLKTTYFRDAGNRKSQTKQLFLILKEGGPLLSLMRQMVS